MREARWGREVLERSRGVLDGPPTPSLILDTVSTLPAAPLLWGRHDSPLGPVLAAAIDRRPCWLGFTPNGPESALADLARRWPGVRMHEDATATRAAIDLAFSDQPHREPIRLLLCGTAFQCEVWRMLARIPRGALVSYGEIAAAIGRPRAVRAVGGAVGANPISVLIPCHRVIRQSGTLDNYAWGPELKRALLAEEFS
ncbi:MAG: methylated-DNA--[protein]-cysteine S-methyltransferase [Rhodospirillaceae bacterium]